jgi:hypothetical protein
MIVHRAAVAHQLSGGRPARPSLRSRRRRIAAAVAGRLLLVLALDAGGYRSRSRGRGGTLLQGVRLDGVKIELAEVVV